MDEAHMDQLRQRLAGLRRELDELDARAGDFPALQANLDRARASLQMIALALGLSALDLQGDN